MKEAAILEEKRTLAEVEKKYRADEERERMKVENRRKEATKSRDFNNWLIQKKMKEKEDERIADIALRQKYLSDNEIQRSKDLESQMLHKQKITNTREYLDKQIQEVRTNRKNEYALTPLEVKLNKVNAFKSVKNDMLDLYYNQIMVLERPFNMLCVGFDR